MQSYANYMLICIYTQIICIYTQIIRIYMQNIRKLYAFICKLYFRLVRQITLELEGKNYRWNTSALQALQEGSEHHVIKILDSANLCAIHAGRVTLMPKDIQLAGKLLDVDSKYKIHQIVTGAEGYMEKERNVREAAGRDQEERRGGNKSGNKIESSNDDEDGGGGGRPIAGTSGLNLKRKHPKKCGNDDKGKKSKQSSDSYEDGGDEGNSSSSVKRGKDKKKSSKNGKGKGKKSKKGDKESMEIEEERAQEEGQIQRGQLEAERQKGTRRGTTD